MTKYQCKHEKVVDILAKVVDILSLIYAIYYVAYSIYQTKEYEEVVQEGRGLKSPSTRSKGLIFLRSKVH